MMENTAPIPVTRRRRYAVWLRWEERGSALLEKTPSDVVVKAYEFKVILLPVEFPPTPPPRPPSLIQV